MNPLQLVSSLLQTKDVVEELKNKKTSMGSTLWDVIRSGVFNLDSGVGVYAADYESYRTFGPLFDRVIEAYHGFKPTDRQPPVDLGEKRLKEFPPLDPGPSSARAFPQLFSLQRASTSSPRGSAAAARSRAIRSTRRSRRTSTSRWRRRSKALWSPSTRKTSRRVDFFAFLLQRTVQGKYYALDGMSKKDQQQLIDDHFLQVARLSAITPSCRFKEGDRFLQHANACRFWPKGRGIFHNQEKNFLVWVR